MPPSAEYRAWASIDLAALRHNFLLARQQAPGARLLAVVKANAYGHGVRQVAKSLLQVMKADDAFAVATVDEALTLRALLPSSSIVVLQGFTTLEELALIHDARLWPVIHSPYQFELLQAAPRQLPDCLWLKLETGMNRLGLAPEEFAAIWRAADGLRDVNQLVVMSHLAAADDPAGEQVRMQLARLQGGLWPLGASMSKPWRVSFAASGGILAWPDCHFDWLRPGIMLYGGASIQGETGEQRGLQPVMTLRARVISVKRVAAGESVGYGASYRCEQDQRVGIVSIGYGDGYPRHAPTGTPVLVETSAGPLLTGTLGRVSMDMLAIDLNPEAGATVRPGDSVVLWGRGVSADTVAERSGTIAYELFCRLTPRVTRCYVDDPGQD